MTPSTDSPPIRVAFDATCLLESKTGVGYFAESLLEELQGFESVAVTAFPISIRGRRDLPVAVPTGVAARTPALPARVMHRWWQHSDWPPIDRLVGKPDVVHGPNFVVPPAKAARVVTVHDLTMLRFPELVNASTRAFPELIKRAVADGAMVHTVSDAVRSEVIDRLGVPEAQALTVHLGFRSMDGGDALRGRELAGRDDFVLAVGTVEPRKDLPTLIAAVDGLDARGVEIPVVHVGPDGWGVDRFDAALAAMGNPALVTRLGRRSDTDLRDLYAAARLVAYPSIYEGFGLPVLEAMSAGTPVVATEDPAIVEVSGGSAHLVPIGNPETLGAALAHLWDDEAERDALVTAGRRNLERFSWRRCADGIVDVYRSAIAATGP